MGIYYYAIDHKEKEYFTAPREFAIKSPGIYHPGNPFPNMVIMKNIQGYHFVIENDCSYDIPPNNLYKDVTEEIYKEYLEKFFQPERSKREDLLKPVENSLGYKFSKDVSFTVTPPRCGALNSMET